MATDIERLVVSLEARTAAFEKALIKADQTSQKRLKSIESQFAKTNKKLAAGLNFGGLSGGAIKGGVVGLVASQTVGIVKDYADAWTVAGNKIAAASSVAGRSGRSLSEINKIATETRSGITETVDLYAKLLRSTKDVAKNEQEVATATEVINKAFKAGGAAASEQAAGVLQLSQALSSGLLQGDELRSIRENAPLIAQAIANEFKTTIGGLKQLGADGKLTVDRVFKSILDAKPMIDKAYGSTTATIGDGLTLAANAFTEAIGKLGASTGATGGIVQILNDLAKAIQEVGNVMESLGDSKVAKFVGQINELYDGIVGLGPAIGQLTGLNGIGQSINGSEFDAFLSGMEKTVAAYKEVNDLNDAFDRFRNTIVEINPAAVKTFDALQKKLNEGKISAEEVRQELDLIFGNGPASFNLIRAFDPLIEALKKVEAVAKAVRQGVDVNAPEPAAAGWQMQHDQEAAQKFLNDRDAEARRTDLQKEIDTRADKIVEAAGKVGVAITEAAAKIQAAKEIASEDIAKQASASTKNSVDAIKDFEGFRSKAYYDVNAYRAGYGSDTVTLADGTIQKITQGMSVSVADANRDLVRRIGEFQDGIKAKIGADSFNSMDEKQQAALTSIAYNYGSLPQRIVDAIKTGNQATVVQAIRGLGSDNGGINRDRRNTEAQMYLGGAPSGVQKAVRGEDKFRESLDDTRLRIELLNKEAEALGLVNPLVNDYGYAQSKAEIKQRLLNEAMDNGVEITPDYAAQIDALAEKYAKADAARNQMTVGVENLGKQMQMSADFGKDVLGGFINDLREGKSATEALANALDKIVDKLLDIALNALFDGGGFGAKGGGGIFGAAFKWLFPFKDGGVAAHGKPLKRFARGGTSNSAAIFGEAGPEAAVPLPDGRRIPVDLRMPQAPQKQGGSTDTVRLLLQDDSGRMADIADRQIKTRSGTIIQVAVQQSTKTVRKQMPGLISEAQARNF